MQSGGGGGGDWARGIQTATRKNGNMVVGKSSFSEYFLFTTDFAEIKGHFTIISKFRVSEIESGHKFTEQFLSTKAIITI